MMIVGHLFRFPQQTMQVGRPEPGRKLHSRPGPDLS
jgi:hypothetical protein